MERPKPTGRRRVGMWGGKGGEEEFCWEKWTVRVTVAEPKTESGVFSFLSPTRLLLVVPGQRPTLSSDLCRQMEIPNH